MFVSMLPERLKKLRHQNDFTQAIVALILGVPRSTYASYESGNNEPNLCMLLKIADFYKVSLDWLVGRYTVSDYCVFVEDLEEVTK